MKTVAPISLNSVMLDAVDKIFRHGRIVLPALALVTVGSGAFAYLKPKVYRAEAALLVQNERAQAVISPSQNGLTVPGSVTENDVRTEVELLQSRDLLVQAAANSGLTGPERGAEEVERTLQMVRRALRVNPVIKADMIRVEYTSQDAQEGHRFLNALLKGYLDRHISLRSRTEVTLFREEANRLGEQLRVKEKELAEFQRTAQLHSLPEQKSMWLRRLIETESALRDAELRQAESQRRSTALAGLVERLPVRVPTLKRRIPNQYSVERLRTMLVEMENKRIDLLGKYRDDDRIVKLVEEQIALTRRALDEVARQDSEEVATDLNHNRQSLEGEMYRNSIDTAAAGSRLEVLRQQVAGYRTELGRLETLSADHEAMVRQVRQLTDLYQLHARKSEESRIDAALDDRRVTNVVIAQQPTVPVHPESKPYLAAAGLWVIGCMLTVAAVVAFGSVHETFHSPSDLESFTGLPVLGTVPTQQQGLG